jgi:hypothetical protein
MPDDQIPPLERIAGELLRLTRAGRVEWQKVNGNIGRHPMQPQPVLGYEYAGTAGRVVIWGGMVGMPGQQTQYTISLLDLDGDTIDSVQTSTQACMPDPRAPGGMRHVMVPFGYSDEFAQIVDELAGLARDSVLRPEQVASGLIAELEAL